MSMSMSMSRLRGRGRRRSGMEEGEVRVSWRTEEQGTNDAVVIIVSSHYRVNARLRAEWCRNQKEGEEGGLMSGVVRSNGGVASTSSRMGETGD